jgi:hypothetical protein
MAGYYNFFGEDAKSYVVRVPTHIPINEVAESALAKFEVSVSSRPSTHVPKGRGKYKKKDVDIDLIKDNIKYFLSHLSFGIWKNVEPNGQVSFQSNFINSNSQFFHDVTKLFFKIRDELIFRQYILSDGDYAANYKSYGYKINLDHPSIGNGKNIEFTIETLGETFSVSLHKAKQKQSRKYLARERSTISISGEAGIKQVDEKKNQPSIGKILEDNFIETGLHIDKQEVEVFIQEIVKLLIPKLVTPTNEGQFKFYKHRGLRFSNLAIYIGDLLNRSEHFNKSHSFLRNSRNFRISSKFTALPKVLRPLVRTKNGDKLSSIDLVSSQPFFLSTILDNRFYSSFEDNSYNLRTIMPKLQESLLQKNIIARDQAERYVHEIYDESLSTNGIPRLNNTADRDRPMVNIRNHIARLLQSNFPDMDSEIINSDIHVHETYIQQIYRLTHQTQGILRSYQRSMLKVEERSLDNSVLFIDNHVSKSISGNISDYPNLFGKSNSVLPVLTRSIEPLADIPGNFHETNGSLLLVPKKTNYFFVEYMAPEDQAGIDNYVNFDFKGKDFFKELAKTVTSNSSKKLIDSFSELSSQSLEDDDILEYTEDQEVITATRKKIKNKAYTFLFNWIEDDRKANILVNAIENVFPGLNHLVEDMQNKLTPSQFGYLLQRAEAYGMIDTVCKDFLQRYPEAPLITLHDGLFTTEKYIEELKSITEESIKNLTGKTPGVKLENPVKRIDITESYLEEIKKSKIKKNVNSKYKEENVQKNFAVGLKWLRDNDLEDKYKQLYNEAEHFYIDCKVVKNKSKVKKDRKKVEYTQWI